MKNLYIIAGNKEEVDAWVEQDIQDRLKIKDKDKEEDVSYCFVLDSNTPMEPNPHGVLVGNWKQHPDIIAILDKLNALWDYKNDTLYKLRLNYDETDQ